MQSLAQCDKNVVKIMQNRVHEKGGGVFFAKNKNMGKSIFEN